MLTLSDMDDAFVEHDPRQLDKVVGDLTDNVLHCSPPSKRTKRSSILPNALLATIMEDTAAAPNDLQGTQDSLSFPPIPHPIQSVKKLVLQEEKKTLRARLAQLEATYYH